MKVELEAFNESPDSELHIGFAFIVFVKMINMFTLVSVEHT